MGACGGGDTQDEPTASSGLRIASFDFAESMLLAEMYAQMAESVGVPVVRLGALGPREIIGPAMELDLIDLVPEYLGAALQFAGVSQPNPDPESSRVQLDIVLGGSVLTTLASSPAQDRNAIVVTRELAEQEGLENISDLLGIASDLGFGGPAECRDRPLCLVGLQELYGLRFAEFVPQPSLIFTAEALRRGEIDVGLLFTTAPELDDPALVELLDDRGLQPAENLLPVVRSDALQRWGPDVSRELNAMSQQLTTADLRVLNRRVGDGEVMEDVARDWLTKHGLL